MRTTLTINDDVAALLRQTLKKRKIPLKALINEALKRGLLDTQVREQAPPYTTQAHDSGEVFIDVSNIGEVLSRSDEKL